MKRILSVFFAALLALSCLVVPAFAAQMDDTVASLLTVYADEHLSETGKSNYTIYAHNGTDMYIICYADEPVVSLTDNKIGGGFSDFSEICYYYLVDLKAGQLKLSNKVIGNAAKAGYPVNLYTVFLSTAAVYDTSGNLFFQAPPAPQPGLGEVVEGLTLTQGEAVRNQAVGVIKILVPFGVGCLALLTALPVLKKVFHRFLPL